MAASVQIFEAGALSIAVDGALASHEAVADPTVRATGGHVMRRVARPFGSELGLMHSLTVTGRKVGAGREFYAKLAHDQGLFEQVVRMVMGAAPVYDAVVVADLFGIGATKEYETRIPPERLEGFVTFWDPGWNVLHMAKTAGVYVERGEMEFARREDNPGYKQVRIESLPGTLNMAYADAVKMVPEDEEPATAREVIAAMLIHYMATGVRLVTGRGNYVEDVTGRDDYIGEYEPGQVKVSALNIDDERRPYIQVHHLVGGEATQMIGLVTRKKTKKS